MDFFNLDPSVQAAVIASVASATTAAVAGILTWLAARQRAKQKRLEAKLSAAIGDIQFLLMVEQTHCQMHQERGGESNKLRVRRTVRDLGANWSGRFTPGRVSNDNIE